MREPPPKFDFYERVRVVAPPVDAVRLHGVEAVVLGRACDEEGVWSYALHVYGEHHTWSLLESALESLNQFAAREEFYSGDSIRVSPKGEAM